MNVFFQKRVERTKFDIYVFITKYMIILKGQSETVNRRTIIITKRKQTNSGKLLKP